ncbi:6262_t:CDS:2 [Funneliformis geosporum]|uniref:6262_t:CDS:1 n=1 Tax=Funneliformis geosporum TaxID=1117311 RepID=A0A9W4X5A8_9GLOM|nr:6262_t:CDS:2 [Funneliformis geosporum]
MNNLVQPKQVVSIRINPQLYRQLKSEVGPGRVSAFIERLIARELSEQEQKLAQEYQAMVAKRIKRGDIYRIALDPTVEVVFQSESKPRKILTDQIRTVDKERLRGYKGTVDPEILTKIEKALGVVLALRRGFVLSSDLTGIPTKLLKEELARRG